MSGADQMGRAPGLRERASCRSFHPRPEVGCWATGEDPVTCHESGELSFRVPCEFAVNVGSSIFTVFSLEKERKKTHEKHRKNSGAVADGGCSDRLLHLRRLSR